MIGHHRKMSSCHVSRFISWCVDTDSPTPAITALNPTAAPQESSHLNHQPPGSGSVPLLFLSPAETTGGETSAAFYHQRSQQTLTKRTHEDGLTHFHPSQLNLDSGSAVHGSDALHSGDTEDDKSEEGGKEDKVEQPEDKTYFLPRSSPVISRRYRAVSWHGGDTPSVDSPTPAPSSQSLDQREYLTVNSVDRRPKPSSRHHSSPLQDDKKLHCDAPRPSGLSSPVQHRKERRCSSVLEFPEGIFKNSCELEQENAHFIVVDMILEVLEGVKWTLSSTMDTHQHTHCDMCNLTSSAEDTPTHEHTQSCEAQRHTQTCSPQDPTQETHKTSQRHTHSSGAHTQQHTQDEEEEEEGNDENEHPPKTFSVLSTDSGFEDCGVNATQFQNDPLRNAEWLAQQLVREFKRSWLPSQELQRGRLSLRSSLQELPGTGTVAVSSSSLADEIRLRTRMRGSLSWAPPRFQIIFTVQPTHRRSQVVALQNFLCAGCGTEVEPKYIKKLRYCEYLGKYFCDCCHSGSEAVIPGRILSCWDFGRYPVSDFSKQLLDSVWNTPLFDLTCVGKTLYSKVKELDKFRELQEHLMGVKKLLKACRLSGRVMAEFEQFPAHLMEQPHLFSMDDLLRVKKGQLVTQAKAVLHSALDHVQSCELCLARGFICEFCRDRDVIFPFQTDICKRCPVCRACFHKHCFVEKKCPKCARIQSRKKRSDGSKK